MLSIGRGFLSFEIQKEKGQIKEIFFTKIGDKSCNSFIEKLVSSKKIIKINKKTFLSIYKIFKMKHVKDTLYVFRSKISRNLMWTLFDKKWLNYDHCHGLLYLINI